MITAWLHSGTELRLSGCPYISMLGFQEWVCSTWCGENGIMLGWISPWITHARSQAQLQLNSIFHACTGSSGARPAQLQWLHTQPRDTLVLEE